MSSKGAAKHCCAQQRPLPHHGKVQTCAASTTSKQNNSDYTKQEDASTASAPPTVPYDLQALQLPHFAVLQQNSCMRTTAPAHPLLSRML